MFQAQSNQQSSDASDLIVIWTSSGGTRCVLAILGGVLEVRLEHDGKVLRRAHYTDIRPASDAAQRWRIDWDIEARSHQPPCVRTLCPECGDDAFEERDGRSGVQWFRCTSCGDAWTLDEVRETQGRQHR